jgi:hypothetical protein
MKHTTPHVTITIFVDHAITARSFTDARRCLGSFRRGVDVGMTYPIVGAIWRHRQLTPAGIAILRKQEGNWAGQIGNLNAEAAGHFAVTSKSLDRI